jgi:hypothetical protein
VHWCPPLTCKFIAIRIFTRWMKNRNAHTPIRINWQFKITHTQKTWSNHRHEYQSASDELTVRMPHLRSKPHWWRAIGIILGEGHYCIEVASVTAKIKVYPFNFMKTQELFFSNKQIHRSTYKPSDKREQHMHAHSYKDTWVHAHTRTHVWHTRTRTHAHTHARTRPHTRARTDIFIFEIHTC